MGHPHLKVSLMSNRRFAILACVGKGAFGGEIKQRLEEAWPHPISKKSWGSEIAKLTHDGYVTSKTGLHWDGRSSYYELTPAGKRAVIEHLDHLGTLVEEAREHLKTPSSRRAKA